MKETVGSPKLVSGFEEKMSTQKICVSDHVNGLEYISDNKSESFVIDMENLSFSHPNNTKDVTANSRFTRSLSRKGSQRVNEDKTISNHNNSSEKIEKDSIMATSSPKASIGGAIMPEKPALVSVGMADHCSSPRIHHQITVTTANINAAAADGRCTIRRNSFRRPSPSWILDPKRILFLFATLSSLGTILLIYFTLSISRPNSDSNEFDLQP